MTAAENAFSVHEEECSPGAPGPESGSGRSSFEKAVVDDPCHQSSPFIQQAAGDGHGLSGGGAGVFEYAGVVDNAGIQTLRRLIGRSSSHPAGSNSTSQAELARRHHMIFLGETRIGNVMIDAEGSSLRVENMAVVAPMRLPVAGIQADAQITRSRAFRQVRLSIRSKYLK